MGAVLVHQWNVASTTYLLITMPLQRRRRLSSWQPDGGMTTLSVDD